ncbi:hypothetical protein [Bradyrhizobium shewense]|uniref:hypothetical protein n=1 Tax=Bradyrhizobium shewense TaxID=1761772 RepID=UPI0013F632EB|nr:hypothetical protein [Bradyrhizobium shewense]
MSTTKRFVVELLILQQRLALHRVRRASVVPINFPNRRMLFALPENSAMFPRTSSE